MPSSDIHFVQPTGQGQIAQFIAALAVSLGPFAAGLGKGYSSPALASLQEQSQQGLNGTFAISAQEGSWVASLSLLGALFGGVVGGLALKIGRKKTLLLVSTPFSASWLMTVFADCVEMMYATAFIGGFCSAIVLLVSQVYVSEIAHPEIRGCLSALSKIAGHLGVLLSFIMGAYLDWRQLAVVAAVAPLGLLLAVLPIPETPSLLLLQERDEEAAKSLQWLRGSKTDISIELYTLRSNIRKKKAEHAAALAACPTGFSFRALQHLPPSLGRPVMITCGLMFFQRFSGANAFNFYAVPIFRQTFGNMNPHGAAIAVGGVQLLAALTSGLLIDTVGRIPLLIGSNLFISMALAAFGLFVYYENTVVIPRDAVMNPQLDWIPLVCVLIFTLAFSLGIGPISWLLIGELFPLEHRGLGGAIATTFSYFCAFIGVKTFVDFQLALGLYGAFWFYAAVSVGGLFFVVIWVPETKGRELDEMEHKITFA